MNKKLLKGNTMRLTLICLLSLLLPVFNSCQKEAADTADLLATVPSSSGFVAGINLKSILEKSGCEVEGEKITVGKEVASWLERGKGADDSKRRAIKLFLDGESGVDPTVAVFFTDAYNGYLTASLADTKKFEEFVATQSGEQFEDAGKGVRTCGNVAIKGAQAWICITSYNTIDGNAVAAYSDLGDSQSFLKNGFSSKISSMTSDVVGWGDIKTLSRQGGGFGQFSTYSMAANAIFEDLSAVSFSLDFLKGKAAGSVSVLNSKGENAKYLLPSSKIDLSTVKSLGESAQLLIAMTITKEFTKKLEKIGGSMLSSITEPMKPLDGTVAVACGDLNTPESSFSGVVTTDGDPSREFMSLLSQFGETKKDGKLVSVSKGTVSGDLEIAKYADYLKGSIFGGVVNMGALQSGSVVKTLAVSLVPEGNGLKCDIMAESNDASKNIILSIIESDVK